MGSMFLISLYKTPGTEIADDRDSTSYYGAEYSQASKENMYEEETFVRQSVWFDNEDDMPFG